MQQGLKCLAVLEGFGEMRGQNFWGSVDICNCSGDANKLKESTGGELKLSSASSEEVPGAIEFN